MIQRNRYGPWALITGASSGLGRGFAEHLSAADLDVGLLVAALGGMHGLPHMAHDSAANGYVLNLGEALHHELASSGVDVTVLLPGGVDTPVIDKLGVHLPIAPLPVDAAVNEALRALQRRRAVHVPGRMVRTISRLTPRRLSIRLNGRMIGQAARRKAERRSQVPA